MPKQHIQERSSTVNNIIGIFAKDLENGIGINNQLPWNIKEDLQHFKKTTNGHIIVMGRKTFDSFPANLPNRIHVVVSSKEVKNADLVIDGSYKLVNLLTEFPNKKIFVIGGKMIFELFADQINEYIVTLIPKTYKCDTFMNVPNDFTVVKSNQIFVKSLNVNLTINNYKSRKGR